LLPCDNPGFLEALDSTTALLFDSEFLRKLEQIHLITRRIFRGERRADRRSRQTGASLEFADYREYAPGDELRSIDWPAYGRFERLFIKLYEQEQDLPVSFLIDASASMRWRPATSASSFSKFDQSRRIAAALAYITLVHLDAAGLYYLADGIEDELRLARGRSQFHRVLEFLRGNPPAGLPTSLARSVLAFTQRSQRGGMVFLLSDFLDPAGYEEALGMLHHAHFEVHALQILESAEIAPADVGDLRLREVESGAIIELSANEALLRDYQNEVNKFIASLQNFCRQRGISHAQLLADTPFEDVVLRTLRDGILLK
jgi:uncharacterized protein (DUF58 family)